MGRELRIEVPDGLYHAHTRGNNRQDIYFGNWSGKLYVRELTRAARRHGWRVLADCLMRNHHHLVLQIRDGGLSDGMCELNGRFARISNRITGRTGHLFGERFKSHLIETESYLLEAVRYVLLNPVRSAGVADPRYWRWSSMRSTMGLEHPRPYLDIAWLLSQFGTRPSSSRRAFADFVLAGVGLPLSGPGIEVDL